MSETLFPYYERELLFIRQLSQEFARQYPGAASRLLLESNRSVDPHVERLIQSFAYLTARVQHKLDDEFPEMTESLLHVLYPHMLAPIPSMTIVEFVLDAARGPLPNGFLIDRHSKLRTQPVQDVECKYRTVYPVTLWPVQIPQAQMLLPPFPPGLKPPPGTAAAVVLSLETQAGQKFSDLSLDKLRFYLNGENQIVGTLYELLFNHTLQVQFRSAEPELKRPPFTMPASQCLFPVGFERDEGMLPYPKRVFPGYRLLTEFFAFPSKFLFFDLGGFQRVKRAGYQKKVEAIFFLNRTEAELPQAVEAGLFRLGCSPAINLFERLAEPISVMQTRSEYLVLPDVGQPEANEVYSVDSVSATEAGTGKAFDYQPFYSFRHGVTAESQQHFWYPSRRQSPREGDRGTDVHLNLVDLGFHPSKPGESTLAVRITCTNRQLPAYLQRYADHLKIQYEGAAPLHAVRCLRRPTLPIQPPLRRGMHWKLISHLTLNHLSISDDAEGRDALQEILRLYDFTDASVSHQQAAITRNLIDGIQDVHSRRVVGRVGPRGICQGIEIVVGFDEQKYIGTGVYLFASILERFLGAYASINSFTQMVAKIQQGDGYFKKWPPRAGDKTLV